MLYVYVRFWMCKYRLVVVREGLIREIGVSNWNICHIEEIVEAGLPLPAVNQIEIHPLCTQKELIAYLQVSLVK